MCKDVNSLGYESVSHISYIIHHYIYIFTSIHGHVSIHFICSNSLELQEMQLIAGILIGVLLYICIRYTCLRTHKKNADVYSV